ncbi:MAG: glycerol-3-phosphate acyltransferase [Clostridiales bacterium]|nr:glycerol-3-phosphate acyltransferase [Clostridiales bacterium]
MTFFNGIFTLCLWTGLVCILIGYLLGNIQTAIIVSRAYYHDDVRNHGSGNAGSTNMVRVYGYGPGAITFAGDSLKALLGVLIGQLVCGTVGGYLAGLFVVVGHCWPVFDGFRGGKGVASSYSIAIITFPLGALGAIAIGGAILLINKKMSIMSLAAMLLFFVAELIFRLNDVPLVVLAGALAVVVFVRHTDNIRRLIHGEEQRLRKEGL